MSRPRPRAFSPEPASPRRVRAAVRTSGISSVRARRSFSPHWAFLVGADFLGGYKLKVAQGDRYAVLDLSKVWMLSIGLEYAWGNREEKR